MTGKLDTGRCAAPNCPLIQWPDYRRTATGNCTLGLSLRRMSITEKLLAAWKFCISFRKRDWQLADYPVVIRKQRLETGSEPSPSARRSATYSATIVNWWVMTGGGETPAKTMANLVDQFGRMKEARHSDSKAMPRPEFIQRVLGLDWALVSDESSLWDFHTENTNEVLNTKIKKVYGVEVSDLTWSVSG